MPAQRLRVPMFFKILAGCLLLASLLIIGGGIAFRHRSRLESRGLYLDRHFHRYMAYHQAMGRTVSSVAEVLAGGPLFAQALATPAAPGTPRAAAIAEDTFALLSGKNALKPDIMLVFDATGGLVWGKIAGDDTPLESQELGEMEAVSRVRAGSAYFDKVLILRDRAYQIAGVPIRRPDSGTGTGNDPAAPAPASGERPRSPSDVVGGLILGISLQRYFEDYKLQSDKREEMQQRLTLFYQGRVVASAAPEAEWPELARALPIPRDQWRYADERGSYRQRIAQLSTGTYDVYGPHEPQDPTSAQALLQGFANLDAGTIAEAYLLRSRRDVNTDPGIPWDLITIGIVLSLVIAFFLARWITRPIQAFAQKAGQILAGETDLTQRIAIQSRDETQDLAKNLNYAFDRLYRLASEVQHAAFQVGASSAEISAASRQTLSGLKEQTVKIEGSTAAITELSASIQQVATNAAEATKMAEKSNEAVTAAVSRMQEIRTTVEESGEKMRELGESSKRIGNIVEVIRQISEQTSLLALNASIEAAHAGEQGRGFAVVADEVSSLARRVGQSAKDIEALIQTIKEQTTEALSSMQSGTSEVEQGTQLVATTLKDLQTLIHVVKDTATAVQEQAVVSDEIARNMDAVQSITAEVLSGSEESVVQAEQLHELAFVLERSVSGFNLNASKGTGMDGDRVDTHGDRSRRDRDHGRDHAQGRAHDAGGNAQRALPAPKRTSGTRSLPDADR